MKLLKYMGLALFMGLIICIWAINPSFSTNKPEIWQLHQGDRPIPTPLVTVEPKVAVKDKLVIYGNSNEQSLIGYLAYPETKNESTPAILVIHEWWGLNDNIKSITRRLAGEGYIALAVDLYNGSVADTPEKAKQLVTLARSNKTELEANIKQAYQYLETKEQATKIGSIGWCFGGFWSLNTALLFPDQLDASVIYYGGGIPTDKETLEPLSMPILGIFGELDTNPDVATVQQLETNLNELGKTAEIHIYPNADHAFANPSGTRYNEEAAEDAWQKTLVFFQKYLGLAE